MNSTISKQTDGTITLEITIAQVDIQKTKNDLIDESVKNADLPGFRKGKAPRKLVEEKLDKEKLKEEVLKKLLPNFYIQAVTQHKLRPIINPKIHIDKIEDEKDWTFSAITCESPVLELGDYKKTVQAVTAKSKIILPGKEPQSAKLEDIVKALLESCSAKIPKILIDHEADKLLAQTLDEIKRLGLTLDQYLSSTGKTPEQLREEYEKKAETDIKLEAILQTIAEKERITVSDTEIEEAIRKAKDDAEKKHLEANRYLLAAILRQQKTLDFIRNL